MGVLRWIIHKNMRRLRRAVCGRLYVDRHPDRGRSVFIAGAGRSGTTWLADLIASQVACRVMFEPFDPRRVPEYSRFNYFQYMRPQARHAELEAYLDRVLTGRIRNRWIDRQVETILPGYRVIKAIRACLMLRWIHGLFPQVPILFLIRHPCSVVASRMRLSWATDGDIAALLSQPELLEDILGPKMPFIEGAATDEEKHAIVWCVSNLVPLVQFRDARLDVVFFEDLVSSPEAVIPRVFRSVALTHRDSVFEYHQRPSTTSERWSAVVRGSSPSEAWRGGLSDGQVSRVMKVVRDFELDGLYGCEGSPRGLLPAHATRLFDPDR